LAVDECGAFPVVKNEKYQHIETHVTEGHIKNFVSRMSALPALIRAQRLVHREVFFAFGAEL
jgi:hypothetical protein